MSNNSLINSYKYNGGYDLKQYSNFVSGDFKAPNWGSYKRCDKSPQGEKNKAAFAYFVIASTGFVYATSAKALVRAFLGSMNPSADVLALANIEVDLSTIPVGRSITVKWRGKPLFVRHRTQDEIDLANQVDLSSLRHPQTDLERVKPGKPEWMVLLGVCTHLGCVPLGESGEYRGWFCPCHGSHYDTSGRIRKGPAPLNLEVPPYKFTSDTNVIVGINE